MRGCVYEPATVSVSPRVEGEFGFAEIRVVSFPDLHAGKIVAALDRQHPRDLFDVRDLLASEGISDELLQVRENLIGAIAGNMPAEHRRFLTTVKRGEPEWALLDLSGSEALPGVGGENEFPRAALWLERRTVFG